MIHYHFEFADGRQLDYEVVLDAFPPVQTPQSDDCTPHWARLDFNRCQNCTLAQADGATCPAATALIPLVNDWSKVVSHEPVKVSVTTDRRRVEAQMTAQQGLSSLLGLVIALSDCPHTQFFRPMAHFHLPFANLEETLFRVVATCLLVDYFSNAAVSGASFDSQRLVQIYGNMKTVNEGLARRIRAASGKDASANAVVILHIVSCLLPMELEESMAQLKALFLPAIHHAGPGEEDNTEHPPPLGLSGADKQ